MTNSDELKVVEQIANEIVDQVNVIVDDVNEALDDIETNTSDALEGLVEQINELDEENASQHERINLLEVEDETRSLELEDEVTFLEERVVDLEVRLDAIINHLCMTDLVA